MRHVLRKRGMASSRFLVSVWRLLAPIGSLPGGLSQMAARSMACENMAPRPSCLRASELEAFRAWPMFHLASCSTTPHLNASSTIGSLQKSSARHSSAASAIDTFVPSFLPTREPSNSSLCGSTFTSSRTIPLDRTCLSSMLTISLRRELAGPKHARQIARKSQARRRTSSSDCPDATFGGPAQ